MEKTQLLLPEEQLARYPLTRYMGSKRKLVNEIWKVASEISFESAIDLFSGSGIVSYLFKSHGKKVVSCDFMHMNALVAKTMIENDNVILNKEEAERIIVDKGTDHFVSDTFNGIYYSDEDNYQIDVIRHNINSIKDEYKRSIALEALIRACTKKRPRGIFTYTGIRYDDGRRDLKLSIFDQFLKAVEEINGAVFSNGHKSVAVCSDSLLVDYDADLIYIDPPYYNPSGDNDYVRRYHFLEGLARGWEGVDIDYRTKTHKFPSYKSQFSTKEGAYKAFDYLFEKYKDKTILVSYSSNSLPTMEEMVMMMEKHLNKVDVIPIDYKYTFANRENNKKNAVKEYIFVGRH